MKKHEIIAVDFDGTIVLNRYPEIGRPCPHAFETLKKLKDMGCVLILWTVRCGKELDDAVQFCKDHGLEFDGINENPNQEFLGSVKVCADTYIDDKSFGCPILKQFNKELGCFDEYVDWQKINDVL